MLRYRYQDMFHSTASPRVNPLFEGVGLPYEAVQAVSDIIYYLEEQANGTVDLLLSQEKESGVDSGDDPATEGFTARALTGQRRLFGILRQTLDQAAYLHERDIRQGVQQEMIKREAEAEQQHSKRRNAMKVHKTTVIEMPTPDKDQR